MTNPCQGHAAESARAEHMKEAERLMRQYTTAVLEQNYEAIALYHSALLAHIQRGAVPEGWQVVPKEPTPEMLAGGWGYWLNVMEPGKQRDTAAKEYAAMLAAAPAPDQFRAAAKMMAEPADDRIAAAIHYPECWDTAAYPTVESALAEVFAHYHCTEHDAPAEVPMPDVFMYGVKEPDGGAWMQEVCVSTLKGDVDELVDDLNEGREDADTRYTSVSLVTTDDAERYGDAREDAGYARGLKEAGRDAEIEALRLYVRALCKAVDAATEFAGTVAGGASWWDDVWADHAAALDRARERISQAALRGEVK